MRIEQSERTPLNLSFRLAALTLLCITSLTAAAVDKDATYTVTGLQAEAEIIVDTYGVPHIYAQDHYDVFFVQGFNAARDRLWQIDLWRKRGLGELAESFGPEYVQQDSAARLFLYQGDMYAEWLDINAQLCETCFVVSNMVKSVAITAQASLLKGNEFHEETRCHEGNEGHEGHESHESQEHAFRGR